MFLRERNSYLRVYRTKWKNVKRKRINGDEFVELYNILRNNNARDIGEIVVFEWYVKMLVIFINAIELDYEDYSMSKARKEVWRMLYYNDKKSIDYLIYSVNAILNKK